MSEQRSKPMDWQLKDEVRRNLDEIEKRYDAQMRRTKRSILILSTSMIILSLVALALVVGVK